MTGDRRQVARYEDRKVVGYPEDVARLLAAMRARGELLGFRPAVPVPGTEHVAVAVRLRAQQPAPVAVRRSHRVRWIAAGATVGIGVLAGLGYLVYSAVMAVIPLLPGAIALVVLLALVWFLLGQVGACPGLHCPGCRHR